MELEQFWSIIEAGGAGAAADPDRQLSAVRRELGKLPPEQVREFQHRYNERLAHAYTWDLWGAAYLINGGCSDDGFHYFRDWLISRGRAVYDAAVENPDTLAGLTDPERDDYELEDLRYLPLEVYEAKAGKQMPPAEFPWPDEPRGENWDFDDEQEILRRLPGLGKKYVA